MSASTPIGPPNSYSKWCFASGILQLAQCTEARFAETQSAGQINAVNNVAVWFVRFEKCEYVRMVSQN